MWSGIEEAEVIKLKEKVKARRQDNHLEVRSKNNQEAANKQDLAII